ncbi:MAG: hypothetical protein AAF721_09315 [Myxococcota bacterium]
MVGRDHQPRWVALVAVLALPAGCHRSFSCADDTQCTLAGQSGVCEAEGFCSFVDETCDSGRRFGAHAGRDVAGNCVVEAGSTSNAAGSEGTAAGTTSMTDASDSARPVETSSESGAATSTTGPVDPCSPLPDSEPILVDADDTVIERLRIVSDGVPAIRVDGHRGVVIRNVEILHRGAPGIQFAGSPDLQIVDVVIEHDDAPAAGPHASGGQANIEGRDSTGVVVERVRVTRGSSGIVLDNTPGARLSFIEGHDVRGPGDAAFVRLDESDDAVLEDFSIINPLDTGRPQSLIQVEASSDVVVRRGLMDGHNAEFGYGVHFVQTPGQHSGGLVEDVDGIRMTNGAFSCFPFGADITFRRTRARDNICEILSIPVPDCDMVGDNDGCIPGSGGISWGASLSSDNVTIEDSAYFGVCMDPVWPETIFDVQPDQLTEVDFPLRDPVVVAPCWLP